MTQVTLNLRLAKSYSLPVNLTTKVPIPQLNAAAQLNIVQTSTLLTTSYTYVGTIL